MGKFWRLIDWKCWALSSPHLWADGENIWYSRELYLCWVFYLFQYWKNMLQVWGITYAMLLNTDFVVCSDRALMILGWRKLSSVLKWPPEFSFFENIFCSQHRSFFLLHLMQRSVRTLEHLGAQFYLHFCLCNQFSWMLINHTCKRPQSTLTFSQEL